MPLSYTFWNRLEPSPRAASPDGPGVARALAAEVHDPLWFLTRQWQLGELRGEDAASPAWIELRTESAVDATWRASRAGAPSASLLTPPHSLPGMPLERALMGEPGEGWDLSLSVELSQTFEALLRERSGAASDAPLLRQLRARFPLRALEGDDDALRFARVCARRAWDGFEFARAAGGELWRELGVALDEGQAAALAAFQDHVRSVHGSLRAEPPPAWDPERLDYDASVGLHSPDAEVARLRVRPGSDGTTDWYSADATHAGGFAVGRTRAFIPGNVRFRGMPNARFWDFESSRSDLGDLTVDLRDLGRLAVMDFAIVHGNDWFVVPLPMHVGTACRVARLSVHDVFGGVTDVLRAERYSPGWSMFSTSVAGGGVADLFHLPASSSFTAQHGPTLEDVRFLRDEGANLAWAVEASVCDAVGVPRTARERGDALLRARDAVAPTPSPSGEGPPPVAQYALQTDVPAYWYPLVPERGEDGAVWLRRGDFVTSAQAIAHPDGRLLGERATVLVRSDAVPEAGVRVVRRRMVSRWIDGSLHVWTQRVALPGTSEGSSGLRYDALTWRR